MNKIIDLLPVFIPLITSFIGLVLTVIFTSLNHTKKMKYLRNRIDTLEKENNDINLNFKLYKEKMDNWAFDMKVDLKKAVDENTLLIKKLEMYKNNNSVEYNRELEKKLQDYLKSSDTLSNELLKVKNLNVELVHKIEELTFENNKLKEKLGLLEKELDKQVSFIENVKKFEDAIKNFDFSKKEETPKEIAPSQPKSDFRGSIEKDPIVW
ncbi:hypothetical protein [Metamycoplasma auris]|uniref:Uncharacterized protein n=1 Tax=Metamycoplasma auris TaxID=51363 RepID=A0A2W7G0H2_9BACT|nr:hypothetical protein [Metamycoplasma auris]PZV98710.1 hypothetical protein BCF89_1133 [Metamycoplasma auris]